MKARNDLGLGDSLPREERGKFEVKNLLKINVNGIQGVLDAETQGEAPAVVNKGSKEARIVVTLSDGTARHIQLGANEKFVFPENGVWVISRNHYAYLVEIEPGGPKGWATESFYPESVE